MIHSLFVENIALIDRLNIEFADGLNVLTGETGAGKSIIVDSMNLVLGERADRELIRRNTDKARVEAVLYLDAEGMRDVFALYGIVPDDELIISRELSTSGKNVCRINGVAVNLSTLKEFMDHVIDLHGQHEHQALLHAVNHIAFVDSFGGAMIATLKQKIGGLYQELKSLETRLKGLGGNRSERRHAADLLDFQINELTEAQLAPGELDELRSERNILANAQAIATALNRSYEMLYLGDEMGVSALSCIKNSADMIGVYASYSQDYADITSRLMESYYALDEASHDIHEQSEGILFDEQRQIEVEERIEFLNSLKRKYDAVSEDDLITFLEKAIEKQEELVHSDELSKELACTIKHAQDDLYALYEKLSAIRKKTAATLEKQLIRELADLGMPNAKFETHFSALPLIGEAIFGREGIDELEFYISTNAGEPVKPLSRTASGGEISRIMLAFKNISAGIDQISTMIFDEIDTGISGHMAHTVAEKLASIAKSRQVICVTHLAQIAAIADRNFLIQKKSESGVTNTLIEELDESGILAELSRLSGGVPSQNAAAYAKDLRENALNIKRGV